MEPTITKYGPGDHEQLLRFGEANYITIQRDLNSNFDSLLQKRWIVASKLDAMNYSIEPGSLKTKLLKFENNFQLVAKLLEGRGPGKRRTPQTMVAIKMPFDPEQFNFTKAQSKEILFKIEYENKTTENPLKIDATILVNKSPIEYCSSLLVPFLDRCLPQVLTKESLHLAISIIALSDCKSLRMGFNSLGSMASVNHLHWHIYYFDHRSPVENLPIIDHILQDWPVPALVFEINKLNDKHISDTVKDVMRIINYCLNDGQICHNLFITRTNNSSIRILLWLLEPRWGQKDNANLNVAFCELSGYFMCKTMESFNNIDVHKCLECLNSINSKHEQVLHLL